MTFDIRNKKRSSEQTISTRLTKILNQRPNNLHLMIYIKDQILFQVMPAKNFTKNGLVASSPNDFVALHFFNKNKTLTIEKLNKFRGSEFEKDFFFFEKPKGNFNYLKILGQDPAEIEKEIYSNFKEIYDLEDLSDISIEYADY